MITKKKRRSDTWLKRVRACEKVGEFFRAYDTACRGLVACPRDRELRYRAVLALARAGATEQAVKQYHELKLDRARDVDSRSLYARLMKDRAYVAPSERRPTELAGAAALYEAVYRTTNDTFPAINAASLALLAGEQGRAMTIAREVLTLLGDRRPGKGEKAYWHWATLTEAHLILGKVDTAGVTAAAAVAASGRDLAMLAATGRQLSLVGKARGVELPWLDRFRPGPVVHFTGHRIAPRGMAGRFPAAAERHVRKAIGVHLERLRPSFGYGSLAGGADILFAEALLESGASLHVILPFRRDEFIEQSVRPCGPGWVKRFEACAAAAADVRFATEDAYLGDDTLFTYASRYAMGLAVLRAHRIFAHVRQLAVWDGAPAAGSAGAAIDIDIWKRLGHEQTIIQPGSGAAGVKAPSPPAIGASIHRRRARAMLFGDIKGFSKLTDRQLPAFVDGVMGAMARVIDRHRERVLLANTWGDGLYLVFKRAHQAAECALQLQEELAGLDYAAMGLPSTLALRLGGHVGPVYMGEDPVIKHVNFFGAHVSRTARIEPITPPGCVYVTETFAASVELEHSGRFACEYVGLTHMAKDYGQLRMFLLRRRGLV